MGGWGGLLLAADIAPLLCQQLNMVEDTDGSIRDAELPEMARTATAKCHDGRSSSVACR